MTEAKAPSFPGLPILESAMRRATRRVDKLVTAVQKDTVDNIAAGRGDTPMAVRISSVAATFFEAMAGNLVNLVEDPPDEVLADIVGFTFAMSVAINRLAGFDVPTLEEEDVE